MEEIKINKDLLVRVKALAKKEGCEPEEALNNIINTMLTFQYLDDSEQETFVLLCLKAALNKRLSNENKT